MVGGIKKDKYHKPAIVDDIKKFYTIIMVMENKKSHEVRTFSLLIKHLLCDKNHKFELY